MEQRRVREAPGDRRRAVRLWLIVLLTVTGDQVTKWTIRSWLLPAHSLPILPSVLHVTYVQNRGAAFGLFQGYAGCFVLLALLVAGWVVLELVRSRRPTWPIDLGLSLILGGSIGNLIDRVRLGYVIDFIDVRVWPVFNLADSGITVGVGLLLWQACLPRRPSGRRQAVRRR